MKIRETLSSILSFQMNVCHDKPIITTFCVQKLKTFAPKSSYGEIFFISRLELGHKVLTPKMKRKLGVTDCLSEKMAVEKWLNFEKPVIIARCSLICSSIKNRENKLLEWRFPCIGF